MKRLKLYTLLILLYGCLFGSCTLGEIPEDIQPSKSGSVYLSLEFKQTNIPATRTDGDKKEDGTSAESLISNAKIILVNCETKVLMQIDEDKIQWKTPDMTPEKDNVCETEPISINVPNGEYWLYVIANTTHADGSSFSPYTSSFSEFIGAYSLSAKEECTKFWTDDYFVMTNVQNDISDKNDLAKGGIKIDVQVGKHPKSDPLKVSVELDRIAVKVTAGEAEGMKSAFIGENLKASDGQTYTFGEVTIDGTALLNCVTDFNLIQAWKKGERYGYEGVKRDMLLSSPSSAPSYPMDHYYNRIQDFVSDNQVTGLFTNPEVPMYCLENNSPYYEEIPNVDNPNAQYFTKMKGRTTAVLFRVQGKLKPSTNGNDLTRTFYRYNKTLYADIEALLNANTKLQDAGLSFNSVASDLRTAGVDVYENGHMYYIHYIKDTNYTNKEYHKYYSVMRNTWYQLKVTNIQRIGDDAPGGKDYESTDPIDVDNGYFINVSVTLKGWTIKEVSHPVIKQ